ncbi:unnamed protein product [Nezara viridula]|uniref:Uncharacterized protein n=1 Tax=Nezara viridula TaxID=85310 RepID=A0A9P0E4A2_NEZVI|nr:unnamed protein product [Nezara viridula]
MTLPCPHLNIMCTNSFSQ